MYFLSEYVNVLVQFQYEGAWSRVMCAFNKKIKHANGKREETVNCVRVSCAMHKTVELDGGN